MSAVFIISTVFAFLVLIMASILAYKNKEGWGWLIFIAFIIITSGPRSTT